MNNFRGVKSRVTVDLAGQKFGRLLILEFTPGKKYGNRGKWQCKCDCGKLTMVETAHLRNGHTKSCGCYYQDFVVKHKQSTTALYNIWSGIKGRCLNPNNTAYSNYGGRGITLCERWVDFNMFASDMGARPKGMSVDRIDNDKGYSPENCRWASPKEQANNSRQNRLIEFKCERKTLTEWALIRKISKETLFYRLKRGWSVEQTLFAPIGNNNQRRQDGKVHERRL